MKSDIWEWFDNEFKAYCECNRDYRRIMSWKGARYGSTYFFPNGSVRHDVIIFENLHNRAAKLLGIDRRIRNRARVRKTPLQPIAGQ